MVVSNTYMALESQRLSYFYGQKPLLFFILWESRRLTDVSVTVELGRSRAMGNWTRLGEPGPLEANNFSGKEERQRTWHFSVLESSPHPPCFQSELLLLIWAGDDASSRLWLRLRLGRLEGKLFNLAGTAFGISLLAISLGWRSVLSCRMKKISVCRAPDLISANNLRLLSSVRYTQFVEVNETVGVGGGLLNA